MLAKDLEEASIRYVDELEQVADFHALRHTGASWLGFAGVHPNVIKDILRHSDIRLTMDRYGHLFDGESRKAVESLPNLTAAVQQATGTDGKAEGAVLASCLARQPGKSRTVMDDLGQNASRIMTGQAHEKSRSEVKNAVFDSETASITERSGFEPEVGVYPLQRFSKPSP